MSDGLILKFPDGLVFYELGRSFPLFFQAVIASTLYITTPIEVKNTIKARKHNFLNVVEGISYTGLHPF